ncbi:hypothetical protein [Butyrivibrio virus Bo-Finn]|nr:hypothetical protein [Butyrivibrio virus Bo-Finn]
MMDLAHCIKKAITRYKDNAEFERTHGNLQGYLGFRQLAEWLEELQKIQEIVAKWKADTWTDNFSYECMIKIAEIIDKSESEGKNDNN